MTTYRILITIGEVALLASVFASGAWRASRVFPLYLTAVIVPDTLYLAWPKTHTWSVWITAEVAQSVLKMGLALELMEMVFAGLPRARASAERVLALILFGGALGIVVTHLDGTARDAAVRGLPVVNNATAISFGAALILAAWYRVPLHPLHRAILGGLATYLIVFSLVLHAFEAWGPSAVARVLQLTGYAVLTCYWLGAVWARRAAPADARTMRLIWPWA